MGGVGNAKPFLITICYDHAWFCMLVDTDVPASSWRFYKPKLLLLFSMYYYLFIHPLCALSAFERLGCSQAAVLRDLKRDLVGLGAECLLGHSLPRKTLSPFPLANAACMCSGRSSKWNACCTVF